jgi:predicted transcriptional regulator
MVLCDEESELRDVRLRFAQEVKDARKELRLSQAELGKLIGRSQRYVCDVEQGVRSLPIETMATIMRALNKTVCIELTIRPCVARRKMEKGT